VASLRSAVKPAWKLGCFSGAPARARVESAPFATDARNRPSVPRATNQHRDQTWRLVYHFAQDAIVILDVFSYLRATSDKEDVKRIKKQRLERAGWVVGDSAEFLQLSAEENRFIELKLALATGVRELRERKGLTQAALAHRLGSSQSRVAKMEAGDRSVSLDLIMRSLLTIGATAADIAKWIKRAAAAKAA
jgi:DNA-binding XRE family transcriptional regulator